jgi:hypothetical protein
MLLHKPGERKRTLEMICDVSKVKGRDKRVKVNALVTSALRGGQSSASSSGHLIPGIH